MEIIFYLRQREKRNAKKDEKDNGKESRKKNGETRRMLKSLGHGERGGKPFSPYCSLLQREYLFLIFEVLEKRLKSGDLKDRRKEKRPVKREDPRTGVDEKHTGDKYGILFLTKRIYFLFA